MASSAPRRRGSRSNFSSASRSRKITTTPRSNDCSKPGRSPGKGRPTRTSLTPRTRRRARKPRTRTFRSSTLPGRFSQNNITWVTWPERALAACALDEVRKRARKIKKIGRRIREKMDSRGQHNRSKPVGRHPFLIALFGHVCAKKSSPRGKDRPRSIDFFQSRNFCARLKNKVQIFACRSFSPFLISRRWHEGRESRGVNKV